MEVSLDAVVRKYQSKVSALVSDTLWQAAILEAQVDVLNERIQELEAPPGARVSQRDPVTKEATDVRAS